RNKLSRTLSPYGQDDVRYVPTLEETLERTRKVTLEQVKAVYEEQVGGAHAELGVVGEFDTESTLRLVKQILAGWESKTPYERIDHKVGSAGTGMKEDILTPDKANAEYLAGLAFALSDADPDYPALRIGNLILGGSTLASRIGDRIRQKEGLSYGATSSLAASSHDPVASLAVTVSTNPADIDKVTAAVMDELQRFLKDGPTKKELADVKRAFVESQKVGRSGDGAIAGQIASNLDLGRTFAFAAEQEKAILALTPSKVLEAFRK